MEASFAKTERTYLALILGGFAALFVLIVASWGGWRAYRHWEERHLVRRAAAVLSGGDLNAASLIAQRALQLNADDADANRLLAQIAEKVHDRRAIDFRRKALQSNPGSMEDELALVRAALWFDDLTTAEKTLNEVAARAQDNAQFHAAVGRLAQMKNDSAAAEREWARAVELAPNDSGYRLQFAIIRLESNDTSKRQDAIAELQQLRSDLTRRAAATRKLLIDAINHHEDPQHARALAEELQSYSEASFSDRMMYLEILRQMHDPAYAAYVAQLKTSAAAAPADAAALLGWMLRSGLQSEALEYAAALPQPTKTQWPLPWVLAEAHAQMADWSAVEEATRDSDWGHFDCLRHAYLARALRGENKELEADQEFAAAQKQASANPQMIATLTETMADWGWQNEAVDMLWLLTKNPETKLTALRTLYERYAKAGDTAGLFRTLSKLTEMNPNDVALQNNYAQVCLLLDTDVDHATKLAAEASAKDPSNAAFRSTYAFALLTKGDVQGALQAMQSLREDQLSDPATATYYGLVLAAAGEKEKARQYLQRSAQAQLLPEEKTLVAKAQSSLE
ncbi:MAG TPA: hypothetical protein VGC85_09215 [Chthoniobacterales bacterium]